MMNLNYYRKKPSVIEAVQLKNGPDFQSIAKWCGGSLCGLGLPWVDSWIEVPVSGGYLRAGYGDWIIKGSNGDFFPCNAEVFALNYDEIESSGGDLSGRYPNPSKSVGDFE